MRLLNLRTALVITVLVGTAAYCQEKGWIKLSGKGGTFTTMAPEGWVVSDPKDPTFTSSVEKFKESNPKIAEQMSEKADDDSILMAFDTTSITKEGMIDVLYVLKDAKSQLTPEMYPDVVEELAKGEQIKGKLESKILDFPVGKTLTYWYTMTVKVEGKGDTEMDQYGLMFVHDGDLYVASFVGQAGSLAKKKPVWEKIAKSFKF